MKLIRRVSSQRAKLPPGGATIRRFIGIVSLIFIAACSSGSSPTAPARVPATAGPSPSSGANGRVTWTAVQTARPMCSEIMRQVGHSYPLWFTMKSEGSSITLTLSHDAPPSSDPMAEPPSVFQGTRDGNTVTAVNRGIMGGMACPGDASVTPQTGGVLSATIADERIAGEYTEVFGQGDLQVTFVFTFEATLAR